MNLLTARNLEFSYGTRPILRGVSLQLAAGEIVGVLGPNGAGKTTLTGLLSGWLTPSAGEIELDGRPLPELPRLEVARRIAVVRQENRFAFPFTSLEIVLMGRHPHRAGAGFESDKDLEAARQALDRCGAVELADRPITELSSGERQRVVFARALAQQATVWLLDEPTSFLDLRHQAVLHRAIRRRRAEGGATLIVLHDLNMAAALCNRILLLDNGKVDAEGPPSEVFESDRLTRVFGTKLRVDRTDLGQPWVAVSQED